jgi:putative polyketide hydroxylase
LDGNGPQLPADEEAPMFAVLIGYQYRSAAVIFDDSARPNTHGMSLVEELRAQPGTRVPHAWLQRGDRRVSTLDLVGPGFTLFTGPSGAPWARAADAVSDLLKVPISVHSVGSDGEIRDIDGSWPELTGLLPDEALLVRPDGIVAWRTGAPSSSPEHRLAEVLCQILGRGRRA